MLEFKFHGHRPPCPILLRLALHRRRFRVLELEPVLRATRPVARTDTLRDDAFEPHRAGVPEYALAIVGEVLEGSRAAGSRASPCASSAARAAGLGHPARGGRRRRGRHAYPRLAPQPFEDREPVLIAGD